LNDVSGSFGFADKKPLAAEERGQNLDAAARALQRRFVSRLAHRRNFFHLLEQDLEQVDLAEAVAGDDEPAIRRGGAVVEGLIARDHCELAWSSSRSRVEAPGPLNPRSRIALIHADRHGAVVIPHEAAREVPKAAELCTRREEPILKVARSPRLLPRSPCERAMVEAVQIH
jgi:hypothetical protein